jgi:hypothetical protein
VCAVFTALFTAQVQQGFFLTAYHYHYEAYGKAHKNIVLYLKSNFLQEKAVEATKQKEEKRKKPKGCFICTTLFMWR